MSIKLVLNTLGFGTKVQNIYQIDALVEQALKAGLDQIEIAEPSNQILEQLHAKRSNYELAFKI